MPLGLVIRDGQEDYEGLANGDPGVPLGRERELARLLTDLKAARVRNIVWLTADVHYAAAHHYDPARAAVADFDPFWEFVAGPLHAGTFAPPALDPTFGPLVQFSAIPPDLKPNRPPAAGLQFFGQVAVAGKTGLMTVSLHDRDGQSLYSVELPPAVGEGPDRYQRIERVVAIGSDRTRSEAPERGDLPAPGARLAADLPRDGDSDRRCRRPPATGGRRGSGPSPASDGLGAALRARPRSDLLGRVVSHVRPDMRAVHPPDRITPRA